MATFLGCFRFFLEVGDEIDFEGRLKKYNHSPLYPYLVTLIGAEMLKYVKWDLSPSHGVRAVRRAVRGGVLKGMFCGVSPYWDSQ